MPASPHFDQLLQAARNQPQPQRLLFVFAQSELPPGASDAERDRFEAGEGGALTPLACVDKAPGDLRDFDALAAESRAACPPWHVLFIAALGGNAGQAPPAAAVDAALRQMVANIRDGRLQGYMALAQGGAPLVFS